MVVGSYPVAVSQTSDVAYILRNEFLDIQATIECRLTLKHVHEMIKSYSQMRRKDKYSQHRSIIWPVWIND